MDRSFAELEAIVRNRICGVCTDRTVEGECGLENPSSCALFQLFPQVVKAIQSVSSDDIQVYIDAIRRDVCSVCGEQAQEGTCEERQQVQLRAGRVSAAGSGRNRRSDRQELRPRAGFGSYRRLRRSDRDRKSACNGVDGRSIMNFNLVPFAVVWGILALALLGLFVWRKIVASNEDDTLHVLQGELTAADRAGAEAGHDRQVGKDSHRDCGRAGPADRQRVRVCAVRRAGRPWEPNRD